MLCSYKYYMIEMNNYFLMQPMVKSEMLCTKEYILGLGCGPVLEHVQDNRFSLQHREGERLRKKEID